MKSLIIYAIMLISFSKIYYCSTETKEKELFRINTTPSNYVQFDIVENEKKYNYLFIQIILCQFLSEGSYISIVNQNNEEIYGTDVISSRTFILDISSQINNSLIINATSSDMYIQYQYIKEDIRIFYGSGALKDYNFDNNSISFNLSPVINNTETTYDLYYLGKINVHNDICQKVAFILENEPIATINYKGYNFFNLTFNNIIFKTGYYLIKGNNVNDISFYYFYERINVVRRLGPFKTNEIEFFEVKSKSDEYYYVITTPGNTQKNKYFNFQIILCEPFGDQKSHISIFNENSVEIFFSDLIVSRQATIELRLYTNITIYATSPHMYIQYQFTDIDYHVMPLGIINSYNSNLESHYIEFNITPVVIGASSFYELYYEKNISLISNECEKLEYTFNHQPISTLNAFGDEYTDLNFKYNFKGEDIDESGYVFIKSNNINQTNYTYFFSHVNATVNFKDTNDMTLLFVLLYVVLSVCGIAIIIVIFILVKQLINSREKDEEPNSISLINRESQQN